MQTLTVLLSSWQDGFAKILILVIIAIVYIIYKAFSRSQKKTDNNQTKFEEIPIEKSKINSATESVENLKQQVFKDLNYNQKMSIMNLLITIADGEESISAKQEKVKLLNSYGTILNVRKDDCMSYFRKAGVLQMINDAKLLPQSIKEYLVIVGHEMLYCGGKPNLEQISLLINIFERIDINEDKLVEIIERNQAIMKTLAGK